MTRVAMRADASVQIGTGHVMRCLSLAAVLREQGSHVVFLCRDIDGHLCDLIAERGHTVLRLPRSEELKLDWKIDAQQSLAALDKAGEAIDWLLVDHYQLDARWESRLRALASKLMVIDDLADRPHDCDMLLDQNLSEAMEQRYEKRVLPSCRQLLGPKFALLRREFVDALRTLQPRSGALRRVLVFFGGSDPGNETAKVLEAIRHLDRLTLQVDVVVGSSNPHHAEIARMCRELPGAHYHFQVDNMAELMAGADVAIGAGGTTTWERCCLGLPALVTILADNQVDLTETVAKRGAIVNLGWADQLSVDDYAHAVAALTPAQLLQMSVCAMELVDGKGTERVAQALSQ